MCFKHHLDNLQFHNNNAPGSARPWGVENQHNNTLHTCVESGAITVHVQIDTAATSCVHIIADQLHCVCGWRQKTGAIVRTPGHSCRKHSAVTDLLSAGAFSHPDYTVGVGILGYTQSPHSCTATIAAVVLAGLPNRHRSVDVVSSDHRRSGIEIALSPCPEGAQIFNYSSL